VIFQRETPASAELAADPSGPALFQCDNSRYALSAISAEFYRRPADELLVIGVTGTDGKSSTVAFLDQMLGALDVPCGFISTVAMRTSSDVADNNLRQSTPESPEIHRLLREMADAGKVAAIVESTSHGLSDRTARLRDLRYDGAVFTNITHEHLEFHGSFEQYRYDKANLFRRLRRPDAGMLRAANRHAPSDRTAPAVINGLDPSWSYMARAAEEAGGRPLVYGACAGDRAAGEPGASLGEILSTPEIRAEGCEIFADRSRFTLVIANDGGEDRAEVELPVPGSFNIDNLLGCAGLLHGLFGFGAADIARAAGKITGVRGRMLPLLHGQPFAAIVDYAHTPGSFRTVFPVFRASCQGKLIAVFGSAGERDVEKRPIQGEIAAEYADILVITDEDPRLEDPMVIIDAIAAGAEGSGHPCEIHRIPDRRSAIAAAMGMAGPGDLVVMLGKGHEGSIITARGKEPWDEEQAARQALEDLGYRRLVT
jgi:UDP-N-acetylmuramoyl-L-alanyl-D-glutamate--2,6-diaminopimelate ligase